MPMDYKISRSFHVSLFTELQLIFFQSLLRELLDTTVVSCAPSIQASLSIRAAERYLPRFFVKYSVKEGWQDGEGAMLEVQVRLDRSQGLSVSHHVCSSHLKVWAALRRKHTGNPVRSVI